MKSIFDGKITKIRAKSLQNSKGSSSSFGKSDAETNADSNHWRSITGY